MKFKFGLQKVLEHRRTLENIAQASFQETQIQLQRENQKLQKLIDEKKYSRYYSFTVEKNSQLSVNERQALLQQSHRFQILQDIRIAQQQEIIAHWEKEVESKREILKNKAIDYKIMERLKEKKKEEHQKSEHRKEDAENDELTILRYSSGIKK